MQRYRTVAMNYIQFSAHALSGQVASSVNGDVERDNYVFADLARRTSVSETRKKPSGYGYGWASVSVRQY